MQARARKCARVCVCAPTHIFHCGTTTHEKLVFRQLLHFVHVFRCTAGPDAIAGPLPRRLLHGTVSPTSQPQKKAEKGVLEWIPFVWLDVHAAPRGRVGHKSQEDKNEAYRTRGNITEHVTSWPEVFSSKKVRLQTATRRTI